MGLEDRFPSEGSNKRPSAQDRQPGGMLGTMKYKAIWKEGLYAFSWLSAEQDTSHFFNTTTSPLF